MAWHARNDCGVKKLSFVCGVYPPPPGNPYGRLVTSTEYKSAIANAGEKFGGIYLGDNNGPNYSQWA
jgi:hypothetical protein